MELAEEPERDPVAAAEAAQREEVLEMEVLAERMKKAGGRGGRAVRGVLAGAPLGHSLPADAPPAPLPPHEVPLSVATKVRTRGARPPSPCFVAKARCSLRFVWIFPPPTDGELRAGVRWDWDAVRQAWVADKVFDKDSLTIAFIGDTHGAHGLAPMSHDAVRTADVLFLVGDNWEFEDGPSQLDHLRPPVKRDTAEWRVHPPSLLRARLLLVVLTFCSVCSARAFQAVAPAAAPQAPGRRQPRHVLRRRRDGRAAGRNSPRGGRAAADVLRTATHARPVHAGRVGRRAAYERQRDTVLWHPVAPAGRGRLRV